MLPQVNLLPSPTPMYFRFEQEQSCEKGPQPRNEIKSLQYGRRTDSNWTSELHAQGTIWFVQFNVNLMKVLREIFEKKKRAYNVHAQN